MPTLPGTGERCTDEVLQHLGRVAVPIVRRMVAARVAEAARAQRVDVVDVGFFERATTF